MDLSAAHQLTIIVVLGISAQWIGWRIATPSILLLIGFGLLAGPVFGILTPDALFGDLLSALVSISVGIILFEGGLNLRLKELKEIGSGFFHLVTIGVAITWILSSLLAIYLLDLPVDIAVILGALLTVTGPTVIMPLLRHLRLGGKVSAILKWEGIVIDPIGAMLAVLAFEVFVEAHNTSLFSMVLYGISYTLVFGLGLGAIGALLLTLLLQRFWVPDYLKNAITLMVVILVFTVSNSLQEESGLFAVTVMGIIMANQTRVSIHDILEFKENLQVLLISFLFIVLSARFSPADLVYFTSGTALFVAVLILVVRPIAVFFSTLSGELDSKEKTLVAFLAPRGIVAAAVAAVFTEKLAEVERPGYEWLTPLTFATIIGTVMVYSVATPLVARRLKLSVPAPNGILLLGARQWNRLLAEAFMKLGVDVVLVDTNWNYVKRARKAGLKCLFGNIFSHPIREQIELEPLGAFMAMTPNDEANSLAANSLKEVFGEKNVYQLSPDTGTISSRNKLDQTHIHGRILFSESSTHDSLEALFRSGYVLKITKLTDEFGKSDFEEKYGENCPILGAMDSSGRLHIASAESNVPLSSGTTIVALIPDEAA